MLRTLKAVLWREWWTNTRAYRVSFFAAVFMNSLFTLAIGWFLYHVVFAGQVTDRFAAYAGTADYMSYLTLGVLIYTFAQRMLYPVRNFLNEQWEGTLPSMRLMNINLLTYQLGCVLFSALYSLLEVAALLAAAWAWVGLDLSSMNIGGTLVALGGAFIGLYGLSTLMSAIILYARDRLVVEHFVFSLLNLVSGIMFPVEYLPLPLQWLSPLVPLTWALKALRAAALGGAAVADLLPHLTALVALGALYLVAGKWLLERVFDRVLEEAA
ncbi:MAG: ABC transporter permease [Bacillota bacterium]